MDTVLSPISHMHLYWDLVIPPLVGRIWCPPLGGWVGPVTALSNKYDVPGLGEALMSMSLENSQWERRVSSLRLPCRVKPTPCGEAMWGERGIKGSEEAILEVDPTTPHPQLMPSGAETSDHVSFPSISCPTKS